MDKITALTKLQRKYKIHMNTCSYVEMLGGSIMERCTQGAELKTLDMEKAIDLAEFFKMVGDSNRIRLLYMLIDREICVNHLSEQLGMTQSAVSHQLRLLRQQRLVKYEKVGKKTYYSLDDEHVKTILNIGLDHLNHNE